MILGILTKKKNDFTINDPIEYFFVKLTKPHEKKYSYSIGSLNS